MKLKKLVNFLIGILILVNIFLISYLIFEKKERKINLSSTDKEEQISFYNQKCPNIIITDIQGKKIPLSSLIGSVIILKFTKFYFEELPSILYLEHLLGKFKNCGLHVFLIYSSKFLHQNFSLSFIKTSLPILKGDSFVISKFNAKINDTIIIGKDFRIKFKSNIARNQTIYHIVSRLLGNNKPQSSQFLSKENYEKLIKRVTFLSLKNKNIEIVGNLIKTSPLL
ncbi:hypothetical protein NLB65_01240 [Candidatus Aminicenantes bacterium AC-335-B20]|jgi:hypothetical protein|nr:hypothetical protein [SCandidatus Aminicenantes bacterium Aminicenantia_JdfR_composite]MCP2597660.1 hypothetical protein [Candidatus Aminicenantes bacterium AC-335-G13]MCP2599068.1 hypothetical protein [Candidatus Aminicenantes bacterium AC-335-B20]MCP2619070.1 hypothetical protein [Candidatus Aminicenantes bacterium AC-335-A11]